MKYRFFLYRDLFLPGPNDPPEELVLESDDPEFTAGRLMRGRVDKVSWEKVPE